MRENIAATASIIVVDDEKEIGDFFSYLLETKGHKVTVALSGAEAKSYILKDKFNLAIFDLKLTDTNGLILLKEIKSLQPECEVLMITGYSTIKSAVEAIKLGAFDYLEKPFEDISDLEEIIDRALMRALSKKEIFSEERDRTLSSLGLIAGRSRKFQQLLTIAEKLAKKNVTVLIRGETGTGKELLARFIHALSARSQKQLLAINCGALPESLLESELFGHEKGAFTGATGLKKGIFELAHRGTLFLDEIGDASLAIQVKLLRVLESGEFFRVGGENPIKTNVRLIAATNVDLRQAVENKEFREDLFYRLDVVDLELPPLRERKEDIPLFVAHFLKQAGGQSLQFSQEALQLLEDYDWPGNVRELLNTVEHAVALTEGKMITPVALPEKITERKTLEETEETVNFPNNSLSVLIGRIEALLNEEDFLENLSNEELLKTYRLIKKMEERIKIVPPLSLEEAEKKTINKALAYYQGNISNAARALGIGRNTLYRKIKEFNIK